MQLGVDSRLANLSLNASSTCSSSKRATLGWAWAMVIESYQASAWAIGALAQ